MPLTSAKSAIFSSPDETYHADRCDQLQQAALDGDLRLAALARRGYPGTPLPHRMLPEVSTVGYWDAHKDQSWGLDWHRNEGIELTFLSRGKLDFAVDQKKYPLEDGWLTITRPWQQHRVGNPNVRASRLHWLILDVGMRRPNQPWRWPTWLILSPKDLKQLTELLRHNEQPAWQANSEIRHCFEQIGSLLSTPNPAEIQTRLQLYLNELFLALLEMLKTRKVVLNEHLTSTRRMVEMFLTSLPQHLEDTWSLESMAKQCGLGRTRFADYCRQITNLSPMDNLANCRVETAKKLMAQNPESSLTDIALSCGFQTSQYFSTVFHQKTGLTPREYRAKKVNPKSD